MPARAVVMEEFGGPEVLRARDVPAPEPRPGYAEVATARAEDLVPVPEGVALRDAVALVADGRTALSLHRRAQVRRDEHVLVEAAAGGVGSLLVQLASAAGARVIGAAGSDRKSRPVMDLGAAAFVDYSRPGWLDEVRAATGGRGVDLVFDGVGGAVGTEAVRALRDGGRVSVYGMAGGTEAAHDPADLRARSIEARATLGKTLLAVGSVREG
ncbi:zinc-binding dehydrogenase [Actinomadura sp. NPDC049753]|uniref:zinc-binding dehydrogenase n=1 Tax=Actinomadura sp. NPDC049753 TaxID=3154739 RepID=UPI00344332F8